MVILGLLLFLLLLRQVVIIEARFIFIRYNNIDAIKIIQSLIWRSYSLSLIVEVPLKQGLFLFDSYPQWLRLLWYERIKLLLFWYVLL